ncbi:response regulator transcription factor [candidate division KSB1 bacterium]|nr:response regulator transcription factor [candidate division KSB1 bacterium]NIR72038.1 response regulator transcription factor [candidate division KSB1 bacterium]NIS25979.1 response regulator transcription factor [candidate division KSB1 bacterium]NIT74950.1 response regulator transcription factor [candidate division KSB1 bacterium]NIU28734.1 response regulator transcription factor [candidate division KSB1 bacterium]
MQNVKNVLVIEDDPNIAELLEIHLKDLGCILKCAEDGLSGLERFREQNYDLIILDLMLPKLDGLEVCKQIRAENKYTPVLMLTSKSEELDKVLGLELGADDYITKPFSIRELIARIKAIFRRIEADKEKVTEHPQPKTLDFGNLIVFLEKRKVVLNGEPVDLTAKEFDLLVLFASNPGRAYSRQELLDLVWGYQFDGYEHTVNSHINRLRNKIEGGAASSTYIKTVWGVGYSFVEPEDLSS